MINLADLVATTLASAAPSATSGDDAALSLPPFTNIVINSRLVAGGELFVALPGEQVDGHQFVAAALHQGARAALVSAQWADVAGAALGVPLVRTPADLVGLAPDASVLCVVADPLAALQQAAATYRRRFSPLVIGLTGSVGKTTTKEVLAAVLRQRFRTLYSVKSWNNEIGIPLTLLRLTPEHEAVVLEMGTYGPGDIALLCDWAQPSYGIVLNVGVSHLERMQTQAVVAEAKSELPRALPPTGLAILNHDDPLVRDMAAVTAAPVRWFGRTAAADVWADGIASFGLDGIAFTVHVGAETRRLQVPLVGQHLVDTALAVIALARELGLTWDEIEAGLSDPAIARRMVVVPGLNGSHLLDDTYNAAPASCRAALAVLAELPGRRLAAFGDMAELGPLDESGHREVGVAAAAVVEMLLVVGVKAQWIGDAAALANPELSVVYAADNAEAVKVLRRLLQPNDYLLVKGARVAATEQIVQALAVGE